MRYKQVTEILLQAKDAIYKLLDHPDDTHHRLKIITNLQRDATYLSLITGIGDVEQSPREAPGPATTIGGEPITRTTKVTPDDLEPSRERVEVLRRKVEEAYRDFPYLEDKRIMKEYEDTVIRGVAKKAKMKVTREQPEIITISFIGEIKKNIELMEKDNIERQQQRVRDLQHPDVPNLKISPGALMAPPEPGATEIGPDGRTYRVGDDGTRTPITEEITGDDSGEALPAETEIKSNPDAPAKADKSLEIKTPGSRKRDPK
ncbi:MAG TPA: hypothetical protein VK618_07965 [Flavitalea sp.]|nr:hypothetical protein [Flavitalea sp.]